VFRKGQGAYLAWEKTKKGIITRWSVYLR